MEVSTTLTRFGFPDPNEVNEQTYTTLYRELVESVDGSTDRPGCEPGTERDFTDCILGEFEDWAKSLRAKLHKGRVRT